MSVDKEVLSHLESFGIDQALAIEAAKRYTKVDAAVEWCFGDGQNWTPESQSATLEGRPLPPLGLDDEDRDYLIDDREFDRLLHVPSPSAEPNAPEERQPLSEISGWQPRDPPPLPARRQGNSALPVSVDDGDDEDSNDELRRAILLSQQVGDDGTINGGHFATAQQESDARLERERSLRATAPPPSPDALVEGGPPHFGPSTREEQGNTQLVPPGLQPPNISSEDADLDRAIQNSIMTASMHSQMAAINDNRPPPMPRRPGAPLVFLSGSNELTCAANVLQGLWATPQIREVIQEGRLRPSTSNLAMTTCESLQGLAVLDESSSDSYFDVDNLLGVMLPDQPTSQLPPGRYALGEFPSTDMETTDALLMAWLGLQRDMPIPFGSGGNTTGPFWAEPLRLLHTDTEVIGETTKTTSSHVEFEHSALLRGRVHTHLAERLWGTPSYQQTIVQLGEVLPVLIRNTHAYGDERRPWELEETVYLDRYMKENMGWSMQIRAQQSVAKGNVGRLEQQINDLTMHNGKNVIPVLKALTKFYQDSPKPEDEMQVEVQADLRAKLESVLEAATRRVTSLQEEQKAEQEIVDGSLFETYDPLRKQHEYKLRSILYHDGSNTPGRHLYMYARQPDGTWWRIQDHEIWPVEWPEIIADKTGLHMDGGPYMLFYSREGPPPPTPAVPDGPTGASGADVEMRDEETTSDDLSRPADPTALPGAIVPNAGTQKEQSNVQEQAPSIAASSGDGGQPEQQEDLIQL